MAVNLTNEDRGDIALSVRWATRRREDISIWISDELERAVFDVVTAAVEAAVEALSEGATRYEIQRSFRPGITETLRAALSERMKGTDLSVVACWIRGTINEDVVGMLWRKLHPGECSFDLLKRFGRVMALENDRRRAETICERCGRPKEEVFTPVVEGSWAEHEHGFAHVGERRMTREERGLCTCEADVEEELRQAELDGAISDRMQRGEYVRDEYFGAIVGPQSYLISHPDDEGRTYCVDMLNATCNCPDYEMFCAPRNIDCKHVHAVAPVWEQQTGKAYERRMGN